jgi:hypothetical protein
MELKMAKRKTDMEKQVAELERLQLLLVKNQNAYYNTAAKGYSMSTRMYNWVDTYNDMKSLPAWSVFCKKHGFDVGHDAFDNFA